MQFSMEWLKDYLDIDLPAEDLAEKLTLSGVEVEGVSLFQDKVKGVVVGKILSLHPHDRAAGLMIVEVDAGLSRHIVVCGADNIKEGDLVPFALPGAVLPGNNQVEERNIHGVNSEGMLCSAGELGLEFVQAEEGILLLESKINPGRDIGEVLKFGDHIFELGLTPNRADCLGLLGIAYEVATLIGGEVKLPPVVPLERGEPVKNFLSVEVADYNLCPRYTAHLIKDVSVSPSPLWLQRRLLAVGIRPVSNVVDISNYVMWETGQPLHVFDYDLISGRKIIVRCAESGEKAVTLDEVERVLDKDMLVIADQDRVIGLAGIMGAENTGISSSTTTVALEAAFFKASEIRKTAKKLNLSSDASQRFERGVNPAGVLKALNRAAYLIAQLAGGKICTEPVDRSEASFLPSEVDLCHRHVSRLLGLEIGATDIEDIFHRLGFQSRKKEGGWVVTAPLRRGDIKEGVDIIEEIARIHGYEHIPASLPQGVLTGGGENFKQKLRALSVEVLVACGFQEVITFSFMNPHFFDRLGLPADDSRRKSILLKNPLSEEQRAMCTTIIPNLLNTVNYNLGQRIYNQCLFEVGSIFLAEDLPLQKLPQERMTLSLAVTGKITEDSWQGKAKALDFFFCKGALEALFRRLGVDDYRFEAASLPVYHPTKAAEIFINDEMVGTIGEIHPVVQEEFGLRQTVCAAELNLDLLIQKANIVPRYQQLSRYPVVLRDIAVVVARDIPYAAVHKCIVSAGGNLVESVQLFDLYEGKQIAEGYRSFAFAIRYRSREKTLTDVEVNTVHQRIEESLKDNFSAELRC